MSIVSVNEQVSTRAGSDKVGSAEYMRVFLVVVSRHDDDIKKILRDPRIPRLGTPYSVGQSTDTQSLCHRRTGKQKEKYLYEVSCRYAVGKYKPSDKEDGEDSIATQRPTRITYGHASSQVVAELTAPGRHGEPPKVIQNSAGQPFDPPLMREVIDLTITMQKFLPIGGYDVIAVKGVIGKINERPWFGLDEETVKMTGATAANVTEAGIEVVTATLSFRVRDNGWNPVLVLDRGRVAFENVQEANTYKFDGRPITGTPTEDKHGVATGEIVLLDARGMQLPKGEDGHFLPFDVYHYADFDGLNLP